MDDRQLEQLAKQLGAKAAANVDAQKTAWAVLARLRSTPVTHPWWHRFGLVPAAAAAGVILAAGLGIHQWLTPGEALPSLPLPIELNELATNELTEVLDSLEFEAPVAELVPASLADLSENQLRDLLASMEG
jgi:hypothetical protein